MPLRVRMLAHGHVGRNRCFEGKGRGGLTGSDAMHYPKQSL